MVLHEDLFPSARLFLGEYVYQLLYLAEDTKKMFQIGRSHEYCILK